MWLSTTIGWFSVVNQRNTSDVRIRSWVRSDLERLREGYLPELSAIEEKTTGYRYVATAPMAAWTRAIAEMSAKISYPDFEEAVFREHGPERQRAYSKLFDPIQRRLTRIDDQEKTRSPRTRSGPAHEPLEEKAQAPSFDYAPALRAAVEAACRAADAIRAEFDREGGPRGPLGTCPVDEEAEIIIREHLRSVFPDWQFYGEETYETGAPSEHHWLVDPNDGTQSFQQGWRGSAISIGLLRGTEPVLGVVLAPRPAIGHEDLMTWAEGLPLTRNGLEVQPGWSGTLTKDSVVIVSQHADGKSELNAELAAPARFLAVPSVAYRLALAAVGEGEAAVSVAGAQDFDYAGAHALLKGAGGVLLDGRGNPVKYAPSGGRKHSGGHALFGGSPAVAKELAGRDWLRVRREGKSDPQPLSWPRKVHIHPTDLRWDRAQGLFLGQLVGDALGAQVEFQSASSIARSHPNGVREIADGGTWNTLGGQPTDDSELALALARSLVAQDRYDPKDVARAYVEWYESGPFDVGGTIGQALSVYADRGRRRSRAPSHDVVDLEEVLRAASPTSQANGALMRISPLAIAYASRPAEALEHARFDARLTHPHPVCQASNVAFVAALVAALNGASTPTSLTEAALEAIAEDREAEPVRERLHMAQAEPAPVMDQSNKGWVLLALQNAFHQLLTAPSFEEGLARTVGLGGDTDTNAAIAGALLGAYHGAASIPARWRTKVLTCRPLEGRGGQPRGRPYWPVDALQLAERLLSLPSTEARSTI